MATSVRPVIRAAHRLSLIPASLEFNLDFYTEVQDLSFLQQSLEKTSPRFAALNSRICELIEDFGYVGFETLAVEVSL